MPVPNKTKMVSHVIKNADSPISEYPQKWSNDKVIDLLISQFLEVRLDEDARLLSMALSRIKKRTRARPRETRI
jgi:hypothetical protein